MSTSLKKVTASHTLRGICLSTQPCITHVSPSEICSHAGEGERYGPAGGDAVMLGAADEMQVRSKARQRLWSSPRKASRGILWLVARVWCWDGIDVPTVVRGNSRSSCSDVAEKSSATSICGDDDHGGIVQTREKYAKNQPSVTASGSRFLFQYLR